MTRPQNAGKPHGYEVWAQKFFRWFANSVQRAGRAGNFTYISGTTETVTTLGGSDYVVAALTNVAKNNYNLALIYENYGATARLAYTRRDKYFESLNNGSIQAARDQSGASAQPAGFFAGV